MTQKEKAKRYDEAIKRASNLYEDAVEMGNDMTTKTCEIIFPELAESEDELIKDDIKDVIQAAIIPEESKREMLDWIEKQGAQPTDKIERKFKVGDWIVDDETPNDVFCVIEVLGEIYKVIDIDGDDYHIPHCKADKRFHLWTIADAKDGDVLVSGEVIFIFNKIHGVWINCHCSLHKDGSFCEEDYDLMHIKYAETIYPSTKEQRDTFFAKMKEAGYEWDDKKEELKKIEDKKLDADKVIDWLKPYSVIDNNIINCFKKDF